MKREVKFKYVWKHGGTRQIVSKIFTLDDIEDGKLPRPDLTCWDLIVRSEFTGLKDKNGVEIYEGDIVKTEFPASHQHASYSEIGVVENHWNSFTPTKIVNKRTGNNFLVYSHSEVIGNIHENPELSK